MNNIRIANTIYTNYENFTAECPWCGKENIFNRASDLGTFEPIDGRNVSCLSDDCGKTFRIIGDTVNSPHEMLVYDCYELIEQKRYMNTILTLAQAYEMFFNLFFQIELLYKPFGAERDRAKYTRLSGMLYEKLKKHTFNKMRNHFLQYILDNNPPRNLAEAERKIVDLPDKPKEPKDTDIDNINDSTLKPLLIAVKKTKINELRNEIVHKHARRPTREEVEKAFQETKSTLNDLTYHLQLYDNIYFYGDKIELHYDDI